MFSKRTQWTRSPNPFALELERKRQKGEAVIDLTLSNPTRCSFRYLKEDLLNALHNARGLIYEPHPQGLPEARQAVRAYYDQKGIRLDLNQIFLFSSTSEAYSAVFRLLTNPGDRVLIPQPSYPLLDYLIGLNDVTPCPYQLVYRERWMMDLEDLDRGLSQEPKVVVVVHPNNPTGHFTSGTEIPILLDRCRSKNAAVIADEVFYDFVYDETRLKLSSFAGTNQTLCFTLGGLSKTLGLPQMKLSWMVITGPEDLRTEAIERLEIFSDTYLSVNTPSQLALATWFHRRKEIQSEILDRVKTNLGQLQIQLEPHDFLQMLRCEGGWVATVKIDSKGSDEDLALSVLRDENVLVYPGYFFGFDEEVYFVLSLLERPPIFSEGIRRLTRRLSQINKTSAIA